MISSYLYQIRDYWCDNFYYCCCYYYAIRINDRWIFWLTLFRPLLSVTIPLSLFLSFSTTSVSKMPSKIAKKPQYAHFFIQLKPHIFFYSLYILKRLQWKTPNVSLFHVRTHNASALNMNYNVLCAIFYYWLPLFFPCDSFKIHEILLVNTDSNGKLCFKTEQ